MQHALGLMGGGAGTGARPRGAVVARGCDGKGRLRSSTAKDPCLLPTTPNHSLPAPPGGEQRAAQLPHRQAHRGEAADVGWVLIQHPAQHSAGGGSARFSSAAEACSGPRTPTAAWHGIQACCSASGSRRSSGRAAGAPEDVAIGRAHFPHIELNLLAQPLRQGRHTQPAGRWAWGCEAPWPRPAAATHRRLHQLLACATAAPDCNSGATLPCGRPRQPASQPLGAASPARRSRPPAPRPPGCGRPPGSGS